MVDAIYFSSPAKFGQWLRANHNKHKELWVGFYKVGTGQPSMTWPESVDEALCYGWIDGVRKRIDEERYVIRFSPRKPRSNWSAVNVKRVEELKAAGRMRQPGLTAFEARSLEGNYSYEDRHSIEFDEHALTIFRESAKGWDFFESQPPGYKRTATFWVMSAKRQDTRERRIRTLIEWCERGERFGPITGQSR